MKRELFKAAEGVGVTYKSRRAFFLDFSLCTFIFCSLFWCRTNWASPKTCVANWLQCQLHQAFKKQSCSFHTKHFLPELSRFTPCIWTHLPSLKQGKKEYLKVLVTWWPPPIKKKNNNKKTIENHIGERLITRSIPNSRKWTPTGLIIACIKNHNFKHLNTCTQWLMVPPQPKLL